MSNSLLFRSLLGGIIAVASFSLTAPATKIAVKDFSPFAVTGIRGLIAGLFCGCYILTRKVPRPSKEELMSLFSVAAIGSCCFAVFLALGLQTVPATHASVFLAMLPLFTAMISQMVIPEKTTLLFWLGVGLGTVIAAGFLAYRAHASFATGDLFLIIAVIAAAWGYVRAAKHTRKLGGIATMSWLVVVGSPLYLTLLLVGDPDFSHAISFDSIFALLYLGTVSQALGMFLWCWSLSTGYAALVSQTQIIQPFLSMFAAAFLLGETTSPDLLWITGALIACVALSTIGRMRATRS